MKSTKGPARPATTQATACSDPLAVLSRIKLSFLDDYEREKRGYDPYDTSKGLAPDIWSTKGKRA
jgi:hypothetical protein